MHEPTGAEMYAPGGRVLEAGDRFVVDRAGRRDRALRSGGRAALLRGRDRRADLRLGAGARRPALARRPRRLRADLARAGPRPLPRPRGPQQRAAVAGRPADRLRADDARPARQIRPGRARRRDGAGAGRRATSASSTVSTRRASPTSSSARRGSRLPSSGCWPRPAGPGAAGPDERLGSTTHVTSVDADGVCAAVTCSNGTGSGLIVPGTGVHVNNMLGEQDLNPLGFHSTPPGRRMPSMMSPTLTLRDGEVELVLGSAGSNRIRSAILQTMIRVLADGLPAAAAVAAPRLHFEQGVVHAEPGVDDRRPRRRRPRRPPLARPEPLLRRRQRRRPRPRDGRPRRRRRPEEGRRRGDRLGLAGVVATRGRPRDGDQGPGRG